MASPKHPDLVVIKQKCNLYKPSNSTKFYCQMKLPNGKWHRLSTGESDIEAAKAKAYSLYREAEFKHKNNLPTNTRKFASVARSIIQKLESKRGGYEWKVAYQSYIYVINGYLIPYFDKITLDNVAAKYRGYEQYVEKRLGHMPAKSTLNNHHAALQLILTEAVERGWTNRSEIPRLENTGVSSQRRPTFEMDEYRTIIKELKKWSAVKSHRSKDTEIKTMLYDYVLLLAHTGIRHGREAMDIQWANISIQKTNKNNEVITIAVTKKKGRKATSEIRHVIARNNKYIKFTRILERLKSRNPKLQSLNLNEIIKRRMQIPLFCLSDGTQPKRMDGTFKRFLTDIDMLSGAEGQERTLYSFRHFYATQELLRDPPIQIAILAKQMGTSIKMIEKHYGHLETYQKADRLSGWDAIDIS